MGHYAQFYASLAQQVVLLNLISPHFQMVVCMSLTPPIFHRTWSFSRLFLLFQHVCKKTLCDPIRTSLAAYYCTNSRNSTHHVCFTLLYRRPCYSYPTSTDPSWHSSVSTFLLNFCSFNSFRAGKCIFCGYLRWVWYFK